MAYLADSIKAEEVDSWKPGDTIVINSPTGSGKTTFILSVLLPRAIKEGKHILFLCNRKILNEQVIVDSRKKLSEFFGETEGLSDQQLRAIHIVTYQYCENNYHFPNIIKEKEQFVLYQQEIMYYVYDEAHYFLNDAQFNPGTNYWLEKLPTKGINIFMTATPEPLRWFLAFTNLNRKTFDFVKYLQSIRLEYSRQSNMRIDLTNNRFGPYAFVDLIHQGAENRSSIQLKERYSSQYIDDECRKIEFFSNTLEAIEHHISQAKNSYKILPNPVIQNRYEQFDIFYFREIKEISKRIQSCPHDEKWLVFTDDEKEGVRLDAFMEEREIDSAFLSRDTINRTGRPKKEFRNVVEKQKFDSRVLIATSIMDCGVSIHDPAVKHIVIAHSNRATFLQMLGRKRLDKDEQINLYIMLETERHIHGIRYQLEKQMKSLCRLGLVEKFNYEQIGESTWDDTKVTPYLSPVEIELAKRAFHSDMGRRLIYPANYSPVERRKTFMYGYQISETAFLSILYDLSDYIKALDEFHNSKDPYFFLKRQLSWLGKEYDEQKWLHYGRVKKEIAELFDKYCASGDSPKDRIWIQKKEQGEFAYKCFALLLSLPEMPKPLKRHCDRFCKPKKAPGKELLNKALAAYNLPFKVSSKSRTVSKGVRETCWYVEKIR